MKERQSNSDDEPWKVSRPPRTTPPVIDRRVLPNGEVKEWERPATIPDDFIYDPEVDGYYPAGEPSGWDAEAALRKLREYLDNRTEKERRYGLISVDRLRAAGALVTPDRKKKTLGGKQKRQLDLFDEMLGDEENGDEVAELDTDEEGDEESAD